MGKKPEGKAGPYEGSKYVVGSKTTNQVKSKPGRATEKVAGSETPVVKTLFKHT